MLLRNTSGRNWPLKASAPSLSPAVYGRIVGAAREALAGSGAKLVLGELAGFRQPREQGTSVGEFIRALPDDVACAASAWSQHEYASPAYEPAAPFARDAVGEAAAALAEAIHPGLAVSTAAPSGDATADAPLHCAMRPAWDPMGAHPHVALF